MTAGRRWRRRKGVRWTDEVLAWLRERCPVREHGYANRRELLDALNAAFGTSFTIAALATHCGEAGIRLGLASSLSGVPAGTRGWRHRPVGSLHEKKGYLQIKVAEPGRWMPYQRWVWEQAHPGESAEGMSVIFMDGDNRNFDPSNLERVTRGELSAMAELGHRKDMTREERECCLLRARIAIAKGRLAGREKAAAVRRRAAYGRVKDGPEFKARRAAYAHRKHLERMADPEKHEEMLRKQRAYRDAHRERYNELSREYARRKKARPGRPQGV